MHKSLSKDAFVGINIGDKSVKIGAHNQDGKCLEVIEEIIKKRTCEDAIGVIKKLLRSLMENIHGSSDQNYLLKVLAVGVGVSGQCKDGYLAFSPEHSEWGTDIPLQQMISNALGGVRTFLVNTADADALAEYELGAWKAAMKNLVLISLGPEGIETGVIINGKLLEGSEGGHMLIAPEERRWECRCGQQGCLNALVGSPTACQKWAEKILSEDSSPTDRNTTWSVLHNPVGFKDIFSVEKDDGIASHISEKMMKYLALGCLNMCRLFDPQVIVLAGEIPELKQDFLKQLRQVFHDHAWTVLDDEVVIESSTLIHCSKGIAGPAIYAKVMLDGLLVDQEDIVGKTEQSKRKSHEQIVKHLNNSTVAIGAFSLLAAGYIIYHGIIKY